jgi:M6 family metalloprotease-like protein
MGKSKFFIGTTAVFLAALLTSCAETLPQGVSMKPSEAPVQVPSISVTDPSLFSDLKACLISDGDPELTNMTAGFPIPKGRIDLRKGANVHIIGVDFVDKPGGSTSPQEQNQGYTDAIQSFYEDQSSVPLKFKWNWLPEWVTMPKSINQYGLGGDFFSGKFDGNAYFDFARAVIKTVDKDMDFSGSNFLFIVFPTGVTSEEIGTFVVHTQDDYVTDEGTIPNLIMAGGNYVDSDTYIHEFGHGLGLTDIRDTTDVGNQKSDGMYYDMMNNPTYPELLVWHRFLLGFLEDDQLHCKTSTEASIHWLSPVASESQDLKGVVVPLNDTEALIVESRRPIGYDNELSGNSSLIGAVVYTLDSKIPYRRTPVKVVDVLQVGESVEVNGYTFKVVEAGSFGDVIEIVKLP